METKKRAYLALWMFRKRMGARRRGGRDRLCASARSSVNLAGVPLDVPAWRELFGHERVLAAMVLNCVDMATENYGKVGGAVGNADIAYGRRGPEGPCRFWPAENGQKKFSLRRALEEIITARCAREPCDGSTR